MKEGWKLLPLLVIVVVVLLVGRGQKSIYLAASKSSQSQSSYSLRDTFIVAKAAIIFPEHISYKGDDCQKNPIAFRLTNVQPLTYYRCKANSSNDQENFYKAGLIKFLDGKILEVKEDPSSDWQEEFLLSDEIFQLSQDLYGVTVFSGGAHCCSEMLIVSLGKEAVISSINGGSTPFTVGRADDQVVIETGSFGFEYLWSSFAKSVMPPVYYQVKSGGEITSFHPDAKVIEQDIQQLLSPPTGSDLMTHETVIKDPANICDSFYDDGSCYQASDQAIRLAAATGYYLELGKVTDAQNLFYSYATRTPGNQKRFEEIRAATNYASPEYQNRIDSWR